MHAYKVQAHETYAREMHAYEVHAREVYAHEMHAREVHAYEMDAHELPAYEMHAPSDARPWGHAYEVYAHETHGHEVIAEEPEMKSVIKDELFQELEDITREVGSGGEIDPKVIPRIASIAVDITQ
jgi:hypothetical protein